MRAVFPVRFEEKERRHGQDVAEGSSRGRIGNGDAQIGKRSGGGTDLLLRRFHRQRQDGDGDRHACRVAAA
jgi:hypothetical protein